MRADLLKKELGIFTFEDLLNHYPFRHIDQTKIEALAALLLKPIIYRLQEKLPGLKYLEKERKTHDRLA